jgi:hypothetical protein
VPSRTSFVHSSSPRFSHIFPYSSSPRVALSSSLCSFPSTESSMNLHTLVAIFSLLLLIMPAVFQSFSTSSLSSFVTFFALPAFKVSSLPTISSFSASSAFTLAMRSAVLRVEFKEDKEFRRVLAVAVRAVVLVRSSLMVISRAASSSGVYASSGFWADVR